MPKDGVPAREPDSDDALERGELRIDPERHTSTWKNEPVILTVTEFEEEVDEKRVAVRGPVLSSCKRWRAGRGW
jgi:hypothetical protein